MPKPTREDWALMRHAYEHSDKSVAVICIEYGTTPNTLRDRVRRWNWTPRHVPIPAEGPPPSPAPVHLPAPGVAPALADTACAADLSGEDGASSLVPGEAGAPFVDPAQMGARLQGAVARVLPAIETAVARLAAGQTHPRDMKRAARSLGTLTRTLRELSALTGQYPAPEDRGPEDDDEFILALARKMEAFAARHADEDGVAAAG